MNVLVVNAGSSSLKLRLLDPDDAVLARHDVAGREGGIDADDVAAAVEATAADAGGAGIGAVGHRLVHGGPDFTAPVRVDEEVRARLDAVVDLAPLHLPAALAGLDAVSAALPDTPAVACFDTAFHAGMPPAAATYPVPRRWREEWGVRRYGFHGLSYAYAVPRAVAIARRDRDAAIAGRDGAAADAGRDGDDQRVIVCHLGAGASVCAARGGRSVDTTMGFTPLEGVAMATRSGTVDPGLVLWLQQRRGLSAAEVGDALEHGSGLLGLAGTADMREVVTRAAQDDPDARLALDVYVHRLRGAIGGLTATLGGLDVLAFTGGVGEGAPVVRAAVAAGLDFLGVAVDAGRNEAARGDADLSAVGARVATVVVTAREDVEIARQVRRVLAGG